MAVCAKCGAGLPPDARFCPSCAAPVARSPDPSEERKVATVLFADLVGSTALGSEQDPERTRALLDRFYDAMAGEIERAGGIVAVIGMFLLVGILRRRIGRRSGICMLRRK